MRGFFITDIFFSLKNKYKYVHIITFILNKYLK